MFLFAITVIMSTADTIVVAASPKSGAGNRGWVLDELCEKGKQAGYRIIVGREISEIRCWVSSFLEQQRLRCVVAAGGDGTLSLLARSLPNQVPILPLPMGTENLVARHFGHVYFPNAVLRSVDRLETVSIDAWEANGLLFLIMVSAGIDGEVVRQMSYLRQGHIRHWSYLKPILSSVRTYRYPTIDVYWNGEPFPENQASWALAFNLPQYALGLKWAASASAEDGKLEVCLLKKPGLFAGLKYLTCAAMGRLNLLSDVMNRSVTEIEFRSREAVPFQIDGDFAGMLPVTIKKRTMPLTLVMPAGDGSL